MNDYSFISNAHPAFIESMYKLYQTTPEAVESDWRSFFQGFDFASAENGGSSVGNATAFNPKEFGVLSIIHGFRTRGHLLSTTNPIRQRRDRKPYLDLADYQLENSDLQQTFKAGEEVSLKNATLQTILNHLEKVYCGDIGFEIAHIENREKRTWLREKVENRNLTYGFSTEKKRRILEKLNGAVGFEKFLHTKFVGQKRFSLEGGETTIAALDAITNTGAEGGVEEVVIGMAHRGRLNVLANTMHKTYEQIFTEFQGIAPEFSFGDGDVKYHLGYSSQVTTPSGKVVHLKLAPNPSHLEAVNPVVEGFSRAKADILYQSDFRKILPILIHGDAAAAGQGIVYECVQMSQLAGYYTGGTVHFIINNQVGFTTDFDDARSSTYCSAAASLVQAPVFHVNGDDPEAVVFAVELATEYRQKFGSDVFIDMVCYRRHGHNEADDPEFTQPEMYNFIKNHKNPRELYSQTLIERGDLDKELAEKMEKEYWDALQARLDAVKQHPLPYQYQEPEKSWRALKKTDNPADFVTSPKTGIDRKTIDKIAQHLLTYPKDFTPLPKVERLLKSTKALVDNQKADWALGELLAYGSILLEGKDVRMSGQDVKRGTFSHRHAVLRDSANYQEYNRINTVQEKQGIYRIYNSLLSEFAVLGFEYGYSLASPENLVVWEAQFGDFHNGAQTMIDQFIAAGESKWQRMSGLVLLLPHGYEGQGPEHSSARLERFLQLCGDFNMTVANVTTPANFFHLIRRQLARPFRKPLVVMSPKSLLRHPMCVSDFADFEGNKNFQELIDDTYVSNKDVRKVVFSSGKIYYDLLKKQTENARKDVALVRLEQIYPFPTEQVAAVMTKYAKAKSFHWVQEEPANMGAWAYLATFHSDLKWSLISRKASASPATGFLKLHEKQQAEIIEAAFGK